MGVERIIFTCSHRANLTSYSVGYIFAMKPPNLWLNGTEQQSHQHRQGVVSGSLYYSKKSSSHSKSLLCFFLLHCSEIHWCVSEGLCQRAVPVLGGAEPVPDMSAQSSLLHLSENSLFFFLLQPCFGLLLGVSLGGSSASILVETLICDFFLPELLLHVLHNLCLCKNPDSMKHTPFFFPIFWNLFLRLIRGQLFPHRDWLSASQIMLKPAKHQ